MGFKELNEHLTEHLHFIKKIENEVPEFNHAYVTDYIFRRFGKDKKAALLGVYNIFQKKRGNKAVRKSIRLASEGNGPPSKSYRLKTGR